MNPDVDLNDVEAREYIALLFDGYEKRKKEKKLYKHDNVPEIIIKTTGFFIFLRFQSENSD